MVEQYPLYLLASLHEDSGAADVCGDDGDKWLEQELFNYGSFKVSNPHLDFYPSIDTMPQSYKQSK